MDVKLKGSENRLLEEEIENDETHTFRDRLGRERWKEEQKKNC